MSQASISSRVDPKLGALARRGGLWVGRIALMAVAVAGPGAGAQPCAAPPNLRQAAQTQRTPASYAALADYFIEHQNDRCGIEAFQSALSAGAGWEIRYRLALAFARAGDGASAADALRQIVTQDPGIVPARNALGKLLKDRGAFAAAQA